MRLPSFFGRSAAARERMNGRRNVRRTGRTQRVGFRKQLRTFMCFTTEEKVSQRGREGKQRRKRGSLSQRLRLTESMEDQTTLDVMSQLVVRPSTCLPPADLQGTEDGTPAGTTELQLSGQGRRLEYPGRRAAERPRSAFARVKRPAPAAEAPAPTAPAPAASAAAADEAAETAAPDGAAEVAVEVRQDGDVSQGPSSVTLSSMDEDNLNAYLKMMFRRCREEEKQETENGHHESQSADGDIGERVTAAPLVTDENYLDDDDYLKPTIIEGENTNELCLSDTSDIKEKKPNGRVLRKNIQELIRRHEEIFGPIITPSQDQPPASSEPTREYSLQSAECEPCVPVVPVDTYLTIPQDKTVPDENDDELAEWRHYYRSGPEGVWKVVRQGQDNAKDEAVPTQEQAPDKKSRGLFGSLKNKYNALLRSDTRRMEATFEGFGDSLSASVADETKNAQETKEKAVIIHAETKAEQLLGGMKEDAVEFCITQEQTTFGPRESYHDPVTYKGSSFRDWRRFFRMPGSKKALYETKCEEVEPCMTYETPCEKYSTPIHDAVAYNDDVFQDWMHFFTGQSPNKTTLKASSAINKSTEAPIPREKRLSGLVRRDGGAGGGGSPAEFSCSAAQFGYHPASCWWGVSPLLETVLQMVTEPTVSDQARLQTVLVRLGPLSSRVQDVGLTRLVAALRCRSGRQNTEREVAWLMQPDLPRLFAAIGFGPTEMSRWLLQVPPDEEDAVVGGSATEDGPKIGHVKRSLPRFVPSYIVGNAKEPVTSPMAKSKEQQMAYSVQDPNAPAVPATNEEPGEVVLRQTDTNFIDTPYTQFCAGWSAGASPGQQSGESYNVQNIIDSRLNVNAKEFTPMCSYLGAYSTHEFAPFYERTDVSKAMEESITAYDIYDSQEWCLPHPEGVEVPNSPRSVDTPYSTSSPRSQPVAAFDSETSLGVNIAQALKSHQPCSAGPEHTDHVRNSSMRPIDSEVEIQQVLEGQSGYSSFGESQPTPLRIGYESLPLNEIDSETELGLALPLTDDGRPIDGEAHKKVKTYDSEVDMGELMSSVLAADSEVDMAKRLRRLETWPRPVTPPTPRVSPKSCDSELGMPLVGSHHGVSFPVAADVDMHKFSHDLEPLPGRELAIGSSGGISQLPAGPVNVDSETEMGVVLNMFKQGMLSSRYFAGVEMEEDAGAELKRLASSDSDINICMPGSHEDSEAQLTKHNDISDQTVETEAQNSAALLDGLSSSAELSMNDMYNASKGLSRKVIEKALVLLSESSQQCPLSRKGSSPFGPTAGLTGIEQESDMLPDTADDVAAVAGACNPEKVIPEVNVTTSDGSFVVLFPSRPASAADYYETEERMVVTLERRPPVAESRGFQPTGEAGFCLSEQDLTSASRRAMAGRCADAALRRQRSPSPRQHSSEESGLHVIYIADGIEPWSPVSPEGLSSLALAPTDPELAAVRWRKNSRGEDGDQEAWSGDEAVATPPPAESQSQTELGKSRPSPPPRAGANSWC